MLKGLALTPPTVGRISIGRVVEKNGKRLPEKDDEFTITSQVHGRDGWVPHPVDEALRKNADGKLRSIPIRLLFDDPELNFRANYSLFDRTTGRPLCVGNGETCRRSTNTGIQTLACPAPEGCGLAERGCKPHGRLTVRIGDDDELGGFIFRTTGFNSIRTISTRLLYFASISGGLLSTMLLELRLRGKSTTQSYGAPIYYVDLTTRAAATLSETVATAKQLQADREAAGIDQKAMETAARQGLALGAFEESAEEGRMVVEEFFPQETPVSTPSGTTDLAAKLDQKAARIAQQQEENA